MSHPADNLSSPLPTWLADFRQQLGGGDASQIKIIETHISWVLLAECYAYKIKKPIKLPFLDYSTAARRHFCCAEELRLNRRFAPELYIDLVPTNTAADEWAVRMHRFDEATRLDHVCTRGELTTTQLSNLAQVIVNFHGRATVATPDTAFGKPAQILATTQDNFVELQQLLPAARAHLENLQRWTSDEFSRRSQLMAARQKTGHIRECHGDLHLGNLVLIEGKVTPFDCIEFNENFRWIDIVSEIAFTYVDLLDHQRPDLAGWLLNEWLSRSGDFQGVSLLPFYAVYRALVRAKVAALRNDSVEAAGYLTMAKQLIAPPEPSLSITFGLSGSGKTTISSAIILADNSARTLRLRSDIERKRLFGLTANATSHSDIDSGIYTAEASSRTYAHLAKISAQLLANGWSVIVDAAFLKRQQRDIFHQLADDSHVPFKINACSASADDAMVAALQQRITQRYGDASEATLAILERQLTQIEPLDQNEMPFVISR
ncbi:MAG: hypothetical protein CVU16_14740 [Betaproteobacteria bacterium HGW-Betaproteobacteria-10]|nr:MAG: hypothetical protein CVU16_14740 [Betaproteobacteria bacterium HGW-Betaproteobacteria-10]